MYVPSTYVQQFQERFLVCLLSSLPGSLVEVVSQDLHRVLVIQFVCKKNYLLDSPCCLGCYLGSALVRFVALLVSFSVTSFTTLLIKKNLQMWIDWDIARHGPYQHVLGCPFCGCWHDAGARPKYSPGSEARCLGRAELLSSVVSENPINHNILRRSHQKKIQEKTDIHHTYIILVFQIFSEVSAIS